MSNFSTSYKGGENIGGRYQVVKSIFGGTTEVFLCKDLATKKPYALKTLQHKFKNSTAKYDRFFREAEIWLALGKHPNIVRCYWIEELDERPFIFLDWIGHSCSKSLTLKEFIHNQNIDQRFALDVVIDVCRGLQHISRQLPELVHCDLKPTNILISDERVAKISDFGLARLSMTLPQSQQSSQYNRFGGTAPYAAPEQWLREGVDIRTDIYALGCILYELLSGQRLFTANSDQEYQRLHLDLPIPKLADRINLPSIVDTLLERCLAKQRSDRFTTIDELLNTLEILYKNLFSELPKPRLTSQSFEAVDFSNRGYAYINLKKYDLALADLNQAIHLNPNLTQAYGSLGLMFVETKEYSKAIISLSQAIEYDDSNVAYYANRAFSYTQIGDYAQAISDYNDAIRIDSTNIHLHLSRAYVYICFNQFDKALNDYSHALELDSSNFEIYVHRAGLNYRLNNFQEAIFEYTKAIENNPKAAEIYHCRGLAYKQIGELELSLADYNNAMALDQTNATLFNDRGLVYANLNQQLQSLMDFSNAIKLNPYYFQAYYNRGTVYESLNLLEQSLEDYNEAIKIKSNYGLAYFNKGKILSKMGHFKESISCFDCAKELGISVIDTRINP